MTDPGLYGPVAADLERLEGWMLQRLHRDEVSLRASMSDLFSAGGKRLRPALVLLFAALGRCDFELAARAAFAVELVHAATLVHDDVIDCADRRRGRPTVVATRGSAAAIVIGDHYIARSHAEAAETGRADIVLELAQGVMRVCAGELLQQSQRRHYRLADADYYARIDAKTGALVASAATIGAMLGGMEASAVDAARDYGMHLGRLLQLTDDALDFQGNAETVGKPVGADLLEGYATLPLLEALRKSGNAIEELLPADGGEMTGRAAAAIIEAVVASGAVAVVLERVAATEARTCTEIAGRLPVGPARDCLAQLPHRVLGREA